MSELFSLASVDLDTITPKLTVQTMTEGAGIDASNKEIGLKLEDRMHKVLELCYLSAATSLDLSDNGLVNVVILDSPSDYAERLAAAMAPLSRLDTVDALDFRKNALNMVEDPVQLAGIVRAAAGSRISVLDFSENRLGRMSGSVLATGLSKGLSGSRVSTLKLQKNFLNQLPDGDLALVISMLPETVTTLDLSNNALSEAQLLTLLPVLKDTRIGNLLLDGNGPLSAEFQGALERIQATNRQKPLYVSGISETASPASTSSGTSPERGRISRFLDSFSLLGSNSGKKRGGGAADRETARTSESHDSWLRPK